MSYFADRIPDSKWDELTAMAEARIAKYGAEHCSKCGSVYRVTTWPMIEVEDHECSTDPAVARKLRMED